MKRYKKRKLVFMFLLGLIMISILHPKYVMAALIQVDGQFEDWIIIEGDTTKAAYDEENLYIYAKAAWDWNYSRTFSYRINGASLDAPSNTIVIQMGTADSDGKYQPLNSWWQVYQGSTGSFQNSGEKDYGQYEITEVEFAIPLATLGMDVSAITSLEVDGVTAVALSGSVIVPPATPTPTTQPSQGGLGQDRYDWSTAATANLRGMENIEKLQIFCDGDSAYIKVIESGYLGSFTQGQAKIGLTTNMGLIYKLNVSYMDYTTYDLSFSNYEGIEGKGYKNESGLLTYEIRVPLTELWNKPNNISEVSLIWASSEDVINSVTNPWYQPLPEQSPSIGTSTELTIDGYFADWDQLPAQEITYGSWNNAGNHNGSIYSDGDRIYVRFEMNRLYGSQMMVQVMYLKVDKQTVQLTIQASRNQQIQYDDIIYNFPEGITGGMNEVNTALGVFTDGSQKVYLGPAAFCVYASNHNPGDECEFSIDLETLANYLGVEKEGLATAEFSINNPNIGSQWLTVVGSPTFVVVGLTIVVPFALFGAFRARKRRKVNEES